LPTTVRDWDSRLDDFEKSFVEFRSRADTIIMMGKWLAAFTMVTAVTLLIAGASALYSAGRLTGQLESQAKDIGQLTDHVEKLNGQVEKPNGRVDRLTTLVEDLKANRGQTKP
jgi:hypothetical protein